MRKVVDSNRLQSDELRKYFSKSKANIAVLTDYAAMEAYKGDTLAKIYKSMSVLAEFPEQVIILRSTRIICGLNGRGSGLQKRFIDANQTKGFSKYCRQLTAAEKGNKTLQRQLLTLGVEATQHLEKMLFEAQSFSQVVDDISETYSKDELHYLRTDKQFSSRMLKKLFEHVLEISITTLKNHPNVRKWPSQSELPNTFIFRAVLCSYLLTIDWISAGGAQGTSAAKLRNDMVDVNFVAYATFFDGLLTNDRKAQRIYREASFFLNTVFLRAN
jgi:hypothetical protein